MKMFLCAIFASLGIMLTGCDPAKLAQAGDVAYQVTVQDAGLYIIENHDRRRDIRKAYYAIVDEVVDACKAQARGELIIGEQSQALATVDWCLKFLDDNYPKLATVEAIKEGRALLDALREPRKP